MAREDNVREQTFLLNPIFNDSEYTSVLKDIEQIKKRIELAEQKRKQALEDMRLSRTDETCTTDQMIRQLVTEIKDINLTIKQMQQQLSDIYEQQSVAITQNALPYKEPQEAFLGISSFTLPSHDNSGTDSSVQAKKFAGKVGYKPSKKGNIDGKNKKLSIISEATFYIILIVLVLFSYFISSNKDGHPTIIAGYSAFTVLTGSMESEIPQGSLIITKRVDAKSLKIGDDITFLANSTTTVTHRIIGIIENYNNTGSRAFETQGIMNERADKTPVAEANIIGKVVFYSSFLGEIVSSIERNWPLVIFLTVVAIVLINVLKYVLKASTNH